MFILLAIFITAYGTATSVTAEFNTFDSCETARIALANTVTTPNKMLVCVAK